MQHRTRLLVSTAAVLLVWQLPYGRQLLYPLTLLATYAHELGHGLTAVLMGFELEQLYLHADGSGLAAWRGNPSPAATALIAAGGLVGPAMVGSALLVLSRSLRSGRALLAVLALLVAVTVVLWVRNGFGIAFLLAAAAGLGLAAKALPDSAASFVLHMVAVSLCLSWFSNLDYLFSAYAWVDGTRHPSDTAVMAEALWLPYWFWGGVVAVFTCTVALLGVAYASRGDKRK